MNKIHIYKQYLRVAILSKIQYKVDFAVGVISILVLNTVNLALIGILIYNFNTLGGWNIWELLFLYSFWMLCRGIYGTFFWHFSDFEELIVTGDFDIYLIRPISPFLQFLGKDINYTGVGDFFVGIVGVVITLTHINVTWGFRGWIYFIICILSGSMIQVAINCIGASLCFWTVRSYAIMNITERFVVLMQQYPVNIFGKYFQIFVTCFLPVAFINYYPSLVLLNKAKRGVHALQYCAPLVAAVLLFVSAIVWTKGIKRYSSSGN